jgi:hypothetical protein
MEVVPVRSERHQTAGDLYGDNREAKEALNEFQKSPPDQFTLDLAEFPLTATPAGSGAGTISCDGGTCADDYAAGIAVTLTAIPAAGSTFAGWGGACSVTGSCIATMSEARSVTAESTAPIEEATPPPTEESTVPPTEEVKSTVPASGAPAASTGQPTPPAVESQPSKAKPTKAGTIAKERKTAMAKYQRLDGEKKTECVYKAKQIGEKKPKRTAPKQKKG